jgi:hypothetical protein
MCSCQKKKKKTKEKGKKFPKRAQEFPLGQSETVLLGIAYLVNLRTLICFTGFY